MLIFGDGIHDLSFFKNGILTLQQRNQHKLAKQVDEGVFKMQSS